MGKIAYLMRCAQKHFDSSRFICPNCNGARSETISKKYVVTSLRRCLDCELQFRVPTDDPADNERFYEDEYSAGFTTDLPSDDELASLIERGFSGEKNWDYYNEVLKNAGLTHGARIFDFGCSWGYGSYQMKKAGYLVSAFEVSVTRRKYAKEKLLIDTF